jgi:hypothetical protein
MFKADYNPPILTDFNGENLDAFTKEAVPALLPLLVGGARLAGSYLLRRALPAMAGWGVTRAAPAIARFMRGGARSAATIGKGIGTSARNTRNYGRSALNQTRAVRSQQALKPAIQPISLPHPAPQSVSGVRPGVGTRLADWITGRKVVDPTTGKTPGGWGQAANAGGKLLNTAFYGSMLPDLTDMVGGVFGRNAGEEMSEMSAPAVNNFPQFRYAMGKYGSDKRRAAFEYGVDRFCKEAGFDSEDRVALYDLLNKQAFLLDPAVAERRLYGEEPASAPSRQSFLPNPFGKEPAVSGPSRRSNWNVNKGGQNIPGLGERMYGETFRQPGKPVSPVANEPQKKEAPWWDVPSWPSKMWRAAFPNTVSYDYDSGTEAKEKTRMQLGRSEARAARMKESFNEQVKSLTDELIEDPVNRENIAAQGEMGIRFWARTHRIPVSTAREAIRQSAIELRDFHGDTGLSEGLSRMGYTDINKPLAAKLNKPRPNFTLLQRPEGQLLSTTGSAGQVNLPDFPVPGGESTVQSTTSAPAPSVPASPSAPALANPAAKVKSASEKLVKMSFGPIQPAIASAQLAPEFAQSAITPSQPATASVQPSVTVAKPATATILPDLQKGYRPDLVTFSNLSKGQGAIWTSNPALSEVFGTGPVSNQAREEWGNRRVGHPMTAEDRKAFASSQGSSGNKPPDFSTWLKSNYSPSQLAGIPGTDK